MRACAVEIYRKNASPRARKRHFVWKFTGKMPDPYSQHGVVCEPAQSKCTWTFHESHFVWKFTGKMPDPNSGTYVFCAPAQSKRTWTLHKSHFVWKFTGKMPDLPENTSIKHRAFYCDRKNPFSVATLFGKKKVHLHFERVTLLFCSGILEILWQGLILQGGHIWTVIHYRFSPS